MTVDPQQLIIDDMLAWERWEERVKAAFEDEFMDDFQGTVSPGMRELLFEAFKAGAAWHDPIGG